MKKFIKNPRDYFTTFASSVFKTLFLILVFSMTLPAFDFDAEYLKIHRTYQLHPDGSITEAYQNKIKLFTWNATQRLFGEDFIIYNPQFQKLTIHKSVTTMADGKEVPTPANGYNEVLPRGAAGDASLTGFREMVVTHTGLEQGCVVDFEYSILSQPGYFPGLMGEVVFAKDQPVKSYQLTVIVPMETALQFEAQNGPVTATITTKEGNRFYTWKMENLPPIITEPNRAAFEDNQPKVVFSSFKGWDQLFEVFAESCNSKAPLSAEMQLKVKDLTETLSDNFEKMTALQNFIVNHTGLARLDPMYLGYKIKKPQTTYNENSGSALDKAVLLASMLNTIELDAYPALVSKSATFSDSVASLSQFGDVVVCINGHGLEKQMISPVYMDNNSLLEKIGEKSLFRMNEKLKKIEKIKAGENFQEMELKLEMDEDLKLSGKGTFHFGGKYNSYYSLKDHDRAEIEISGSIGDLQSENEAITFLDTKKSTLNADLKSEKPEQKNGYIYLPLPEFSKGYNHSHIVTALKARKTTLDLNNDQSEKYSMAIKLPKNVVLASPKVKETAKSAIGSVKINIFLEGNLLTIEKTLNLKKNKVEPSEYGEFRKMIKIWEKEKFRQIVLKVNK